MNSPFSRAVEEESLDPNSSVTSSSATSSSTRTAKTSLRRTFAVGTWIPRLFSATCALSHLVTPKVLLDEWIWYRLGSRVSPSALPEGEQPRTITGICGPRRRPYFAWYDRPSSSWKTCLGSLLSDISDEFLETWPRSGSMRSGRCWARTTLGRRTSGTASGSSPFPTPAANCYGTNQSPSPGASVRESLETMARRDSWPTPHGMGNDGARAAGPSGNELGNAVLRAERTSWPTPNAADWPTPTICGNYNRAGLSPTSGDGLATAVSASYPTPTARDSRDDGGAPSAQNRKTPCLPAVVAQKGQLNPDWVEALMGWPIGWSGLPHKARGPLDEERISMDGSLLVFFPEEVGFPTDGSASKPSGTGKSRRASLPHGRNLSLERPKTEEEETK